MDPAASASLRRGWLTAVLSQRFDLCLDDLLARSVAHFNNAFVVSLARLRNSKDVLSRRNVTEHDAP